MFQISCGTLVISCGTLLNLLWYFGRLCFFFLLETDLMRPPCVSHRALPNARTWSWVYADIPDGAGNSRSHGRFVG